MSEPKRSVKMQSEGGLVHMPASKTLATKASRIPSALRRHLVSAALAVGFTLHGVTVSAGETALPTMTFAPAPAFAEQISDRLGVHVTAPNLSAQSVAHLLTSAFRARITDTFRPMNAAYGAVHSYHKLGQAVDFVPEGGVGAINRDMIRRVMSANGIRLLELLGPGDRGHSNHWHVAFARPGQAVPSIAVPEYVEDWNVSTASAVPTLPAPSPEQVVVEPAAQSNTHAAVPQEREPASWDVFAVADWRVRHGGGS